jgi:adenylate cyclase
MAPERPTPGDFERLVLGDDPVHTGEGLAETLGFPLDELKRLWRALGFPEPDTSAVMFTDADATAVGLVKLAVDHGFVDLDTAIDSARAIGQTMARLADWEISVLGPKPKADESHAELSERRLHTAHQLLTEMGGVFEELLLYAWRRHLAASLARYGVDTDDQTEQTTDRTVGFADIVQFTALSNEIGEDKVGDLVELFESRCQDVVANAGGRIIKSLGDSVLFVVDDAVAALDIADGIINVIGRDPRMPDVRIGLSSGPVAQRLGDVFGPAVNRAARLTGVARRNRVIIDEATAELLPADRFETRRLPARPMRGFGLVEPVAVRRV